MDNKMTEKKAKGTFKKENLGTTIGAAVVGGAATAVANKLFGNDMSGEGTEGTILEEEILPQNTAPGVVSATGTPVTTVESKDQNIDLSSYMTSVLQKANILNSTIQNL
ncbi:hypothetical protein [Belliella aquatica]|uniref:Uncharacterized protein n=1 Tax=Belliella aquatica TaxID=1323734 RepID=A0ABQ1MZV2_9BACT|nr:hypothetical protein [Belliella aquatica]MCH7406805.1 hypothetical protein [Belliella aquatica]GGC48305.1 hypothetical protein GCM10010993_28500 [Belliella aquatica]